MLKKNGFAAIYLIGAILLLSVGAGSLILLKQNKVQLPGANTAIPEPTNAPTSAPATITPKIVSLNSSPIPKATDKKVVSSPTSTPAPSPTTPPAKTITVTGFAYEDRTNDGLFNSDDPKLPYMQFLIYDSYSNEWINTIYSGQDGEFAVTNTVRGNLILKPTCNDNFCPKDGSREFSSSPSKQQFAFRSASAPASSNNGIIEGDVIIEGSSPYKFYILDKNGSYYSNIEWAGGHFKVQNLPNDRTYVVRISYGDSSPDDTEATLTPSNPEKRTVQVHVRR